MFQWNRHKVMKWLSHYAQSAPHLRERKKCIHYHEIWKVCCECMHAHKNANVFDTLHCCSIVEYQALKKCNFGSDIMYPDNWINFCKYFRDLYNAADWIALNMEILIEFYTWIICIKRFCYSACKWPCSLVRSHTFYKAQKSISWAMALVNRTKKKGKETWNNQVDQVKVDQAEWQSFKVFSMSVCKLCRSTS